MMQRRGLPLFSYTLARVKHGMIGSILNRKKNMSEQKPKKKVHKASGPDRLPNLVLSKYEPIWRPNHGNHDGHAIMKKSKMMRQRSRCLLICFTEKPRYIVKYFSQLVMLVKDLRYLTEQLNLHLTKTLEKVEKLEKENELLRSEKRSSN